MIKYYTPAIEDFRVGYIYQEFRQATETYEQDEWKIKTFEVISNLSTLKMYINRGYVRTSFLTKEQIEAEGWKLDKYSWIIMDFGDGIEDAHYWKFEKDNVTLYFFQEKQVLRMSKLDYSRETTNPMGFIDDFTLTINCPSINEFRTICKLLNIK